MVMEMAKLNGRSFWKKKQKQSFSEWLQVHIENQQEESSEKQSCERMESSNLLGISAEFH